MLITIREIHHPDDPTQPSSHRKSQYPIGEWTDEPDEVFMYDQDTWLPCMIRRGPLGALCGYVGVFESHPAFNKGYDNIPGINVHGGLTYAGDINNNDDPLQIWYFGFDHAHFRDLVPGMMLYFNTMTGGTKTYKNIAYVKKEIESLVHQLNHIR